MQYVMRIPPGSRVFMVRRGSLLSVALLGTLLGTACRSRAGEDGVAGGDAAPNSPAGGAAAPSVPVASAPVASTPTTGAAQSTSGRTIDVQMIGGATGYTFVPATVTIKSGDTVRWTNVSGGPHNVTFWSDSIPAGAGSRLQAAMPQQMSPLAGPLLSAPNATYTISFAGAPAGTYAYYCTPHLALGMKGKIVVQP